MGINSLNQKYRMPAPRYTSYPTVPYWESEHFTAAVWTNALRESMQQSDPQNGVSLYLHLPFCESLCTYCGCNTRITKNHKVEQPYIQALIKEWELYLEILPYTPIIRELHLGGGTPTFFSPANLHQLLTGILDKAIIHPDAEFSFEAHPGNTTEEHLRLLRQLGFSRLSLGIQDFDPKVQLMINRIQTVEDVRLATSQARITGYTSVNYDLIYGLPFQSHSGLAATLAQVLELQPDRIAFYSYAHVPWVHPGQRRYTEADLPSAEQKLELYTLGREMLIAGGYVEIGMDHFTLPTDPLYQAAQNGTLHRNFMGYTHHRSPVMIGLGVSAISDSWTAFSQNLKTVEAYVDTVLQGKFPVCKGHILTEEDLVIRTHLLNLMCNAKTSWLLPEQRHQALAEGLLRLKEMENDGLLILENQELQVTPTGKKFLRNIGLALDARYWAKQPDAQLFSMSD